MIIIHADDFGRDEDATRAIDDVIQRGVCDETSLMVNMPYADKAVELATQNRYLHRVGIHLNLTEGVPLTSSILSCPRFCGADGQFNRVFHFSTNGRFFLSKAEQKAVKEEVSAQMRKFRGYGQLMNRIDSHHHVHTDWAIYRILKPLAKNYGFTSMRISADLHRVRFDKELYKCLYNHNVRRSFASTDHFDGASQVAQEMPDGITEVMVHPIFVDGMLYDKTVPYSESISKLKLGAE